jgi:DNA-directed RNA polymerase specialized sigma24 family protein
MPDESAISNWLGELKRGNTLAAQQLWDVYFDQLVRIAQTKIPQQFRRAVDAEDVALSALRTFFRRTTEGQFSELRNRDELWRLLARITALKALKLMESEGRQKRGGGRIVSEGALESPGSEDQGRALEQIIGREPTPDFVVQMAETCEQLLQSLPDPALQTVARMTLEGHTLQEIASRMEFSVATAGRKLERIRGLWMVKE